jgi:hypothetical protein
MYKSLVTHSFHLTLWPRTSDQLRRRGTGCPWCPCTRWATRGITAWKRDSPVLPPYVDSTQSGLLLPAYCVACARVIILFITVPALRSVSNTHGVRRSKMKSGSQTSVPPSSCRSGEPPWWVSGSSWSRTTWTWSPRRSKRTGEEAVVRRGWQCS